MISHHYIPRRPLSDFVELFWYYEGYYQPHAMERILPTGTMELVVNLADSVTRVYDRNDPERFEMSRDGCLLAGTQTEFMVIDTACQQSVIGVHFKPGGAFPFFKMPASELQDQLVPLDAVWGSDSSDLRDRLLEAPTPDAKFWVLETILMAQARRPLARHAAVDYALGELRAVHHNRTVSELTDKIGLSARRFIQLFNQEVGLTPKLFCRIQRFQRVLRTIARTKDVDWSDIALGCGYFDQAHFIHDFKAFSGLNPTAYLANRTEHLNHVPL
jgi:AraC-like DNA-binding protein